MNWFVNLESLIGIEGDPTSRSFPVVGGGILSSGWILASLAVFLHLWLPRFMRHRVSLDSYLRPVMFIWSGLLFGINGAGFMITLALTDYGRDTLVCSATSVASNDFQIWVIRYSGYAYFLLKFLDFGRIAFAVLRKKVKQASLYSFAQTALLIWLIQSGVYFKPDGIALFTALIDTSMGSLVNTYYILAAARYFNNILFWKKRLVWLQVVGYAALAIHSGYFLPQVECGQHRLVLFVQGAYGSLSLLFFCLKYRRLLFSSQRWLRPNASLSYPALDGKKKNTTITVM